MTPTIRESQPMRFKTLRTVDLATLGSKPLELTPERVHFSNADGGLRMITASECRILAAKSAKRLIKAGLNVED